MRSRSKALWAFSTLIGLALTSCGGGSNPASVADFSLSATPTTVTVPPGGTSQQISINATPVNGFTSMVSVAVTGLPTGVTAQPASLTLTPGTAQTITLSASSAAMMGSAMLTL